MRITSVTRLLPFAIIGILVTGAASPAAPGAGAAGVLVVRVLDAVSGRPIANADVLDQESGTRRLTNASGEAVLRVGAALNVRLRVRQLGFRFVGRSVTRRSAESVDSIVVRLDRAAVALPATVASASSTCVAEVDSASSRLSLDALAQLRFAAEQYDRFRREYPFRVHLVRRTTRLSPGGVTMQIREHEERTEASEWGERYRPSEVYRRSRRGWDVAILFLSTLAESAFWDNHCLVARRVQEMGGRRLVPLEFYPAPTLREPDWMGTAWLDSAAGTLHRIDFQLMGLEDRMPIRRMDGYITMTHPSPYVARPDSIVAAWWYAAPSDSTDNWGLPSVVQVLRLARVEYRKGAPPDTATTVR